MPVQTDVHGLVEFQEKTEQVIADLHGRPMLDAMRTSTLLVTRDAKTNAPVDSGRLRASITPEVRSMRGVDVQGVVGSNVRYAPCMETGTGTFVGNPPHFPPPGRLETWARRHGMGSGFAVAMAIWKKGGLEGRQFLQKAFDKNKARIEQLIGRAVAQIVRK